MSMHVEWMEAKHTVVEAVAAGVEVGESTTDTEVTLLFSADDLFALQGSRAEVAGVLGRALRLLDSPETWTEPDEEQHDV